MAASSAAAAHHHTRFSARRKSGVVCAHCVVAEVEVHVPVCCG